MIRAIEVETLKRKEVERKYSLMSEEMKRQQMCIQKQEALINSLKHDLKKVQDSEQQNIKLIKQMYSHSELVAQKTAINTKVFQQTSVLNGTSKLAKAPQQQLHSKNKSAA